MKKCSQCGATPVKAKGLCSKHYQRLKATYSGRKCSCGTNLPKYAHRFCHDCAEQNKREILKRAQNKYRSGLEWMPTETRREIQKVSLCCICMRHIDYSLSWPHPMSSSIEHIVPLSKGGDNSQKNLTHTHLWCNTRRKSNLGMVHGAKVTITEKTIRVMSKFEIESMPVVLDDGPRLAVVAEHIIEDYIRLRQLEEEANE